MKYILMFETAIRLGGYVTRNVGPFDTPDDAREWYENAKDTWAIRPPNVVLDTVMGPES